MNHPRWAPAILIEQLEELRKAETACQLRCWILEKAISDPRMEKVWISYKRKCYLHKEGAEVSRYWKEFLPTFQRGLILAISCELSGETIWDTLPKEDKKKILVDLIGAVQKIQPFLGPDYLDAQYWYDGLVEPAAVWKAIDTAPKQISKKLIQEMETKQVDEICEQAAFEVLDQCLFLPTILQNLLEVASSKLEAVGEKQIVERTRRENTQLTKFIRRACLLHRKSFSLPLYENVTILANVFLETNIETRTVIDSFRPVKDLSEKHNEWWKYVEPGVALIKPNYR